MSMSSFHELKYSFVTSICPVTIAGCLWLNMASFHLSRKHVKSPRLPCTWPSSMVYHGVSLHLLVTWVMGASMGLTVPAIVQHHSSLLCLSLTKEKFKFFYVLSKVSPKCMLLSHYSSVERLLSASLLIQKISV